MKKIKLDIMKPFITTKLNSLMPIEDDVIIEYVFSQLEESQVKEFICFCILFLASKICKIISKKKSFPTASQCK